MTARIDLADLMRQAQSLDPLPHSVVRLSRLVADPDAELGEIVETISFDQALTGKLLGYANSVSSASREPIHSVHAAIVRLGLGPVLSYSMAASVGRRLAGSLPGYGLGEGQLWRHSVATAVAAESIASVLRESVPPEAFTAALLHDVGKLVLVRNVDHGFIGLLEHTMKEAGLTRLEAEVQLLGTHHGQLGGWVAEHWGLPQGIVEGISYHHLPECGTWGTAGVVHVANEVAKAFGAEPPPNESDAFFELSQPIQRSVRERLGLDESNLDRILTRTSERLDELLARYA
jgi:putative nucleotidyltransferase with HDIG domain